jgi:hypothetical protein
MACHNCLFLRMYAPGYVCTLRSICLHHLFEYSLYRRIDFFLLISLVVEQGERRGYFSLDCVKLLAIERAYKVNAIQSCLNDRENSCAEIKKYAFALIMSDYEYK